MFFYNDLEYPIELGAGDSGRLFLPTSQASATG